MCQKRSRREKRNEGQLLQLFAGILLLFLSSIDGFPGLTGSGARVLSLWGLEIGSGYGDGRDGGGATRRLAQENTQPAPPPRGRGGRPPEPSSSIANASSFVTADTSRDGNSSKKSSLLWAFLIGPAAFLIVVGLFIGAKVILVVRKHRREGGTAWKRGISDSENEELQKTTFAGVPSISLEELEAACEEFTNVISTATDGIVFKGIRPSDNMQIAVTRMRVPPSAWTPKKEIAFRRKVEDLARMNHDNLVNLLAYSTSEKPFERMLVFEYASNGTLYEHLHGQGMDEDHLDWGMRMRIIMGAAYGLRYMHHELDPPASHFKFDASHVLLTEDYAAKVADFGLSDVAIHMKSLGRRRSFKKIVKAIGYTDWDGCRHRPYFESNIRSFGVFLLETITGRTPYTDTQGPLIEWANDYLSRPDKMWYLVDPLLQEYKKEELVAVCEVVRMCIQPKANKLTGKTPTMRDVADVLSKALKMTPETVNNKGSPLLWAEMQLLDNSLEDCSDGPVANSPRHRQTGSQDYKGSSHPVWVEVDTLSPGAKKQNGHEGTTYHETSSTGSSRPKLTKVSSIGSSNKPSPNHFWADNASELELLSSPCVSCEDPEAPLAASINSSMPLKKSSSNSQESFGRSFRRVWAENANDIAIRDHTSRGP